MSSKPVTKKIINSPETCVDDNLKGLIATFPGLQLHPKNRVVTVRRKDDSKKVAIIGGGGSGHEPFAAGFVGKGMLDGAVCGDIFASPPTGHVLYGIAQLYKYNSGGVLVIIGNYTGDRLNFGKAIEKAKTAGIKVAEVIVGDDIASCKNKTGGRGMIAEFLLYKICGALSLKGYSLEGIRDIAEEACKHMATLGVCLSACSLPGQPPLFEIAHDEIELGAGVHGEAGIAKVKMGTAKEIVTMMSDELVNHLKLVDGDRVIVTMNNLGGTSMLEMNIIAAETRDYLENKKITVERIYSGHIKTSQEMHGFQLCLWQLTKKDADLWLEVFDAPTEVAAWMGSKATSMPKGDNVDDDTLVDSTVGQQPSSDPPLSTTDQETLRGALVSAAQELIKHESLLNKLDSGCGDGDCGNTMRKFGQAILMYLEKASLKYASHVLWELSEIAEKHMGGTSGGIYSLGLAAASKVIAASKLNDPATWLEAWHAAMDAITKYGGAEPGDRTMLDTLHVAAVAFEQNLTQQLKENLLKTIEAAEEGAKATMNMTANAGRAAYVSRSHVRGEDAGARAVALWLQPVLRHLAARV